MDEVGTLGLMHFRANSLLFPPPRESMGPESELGKKSEGPPSALQGRALQHKRGG